MPRNKKDRDTNYNPKQSKKKKGNFIASAKGIITVMGAAASPAAKVKVLNQTGIPHATPTKPTVRSAALQPETPTKQVSAPVFPISPPVFTLSSPDKGPSATFLITPAGSKLVRSRLIETELGAMGIFISENKVSQNRLTIPAAPDSWIQDSPIPESSLEGMLDIAISLQSIKNVPPVRCTSQEDLMGMPARQALLKSGIKIQKGHAHWVHFIAHAFLGNDTQVVHNLGIGTKFGNAAMELLNRTIPILLAEPNAPKTLYLSVIPKWVAGYEKIRLLEEVVCVLKDAPGNTFTQRASLKFDMLSMDPICVSDINPLKRFILNQFNPSIKPIPFSLGIDSPKRQSTQQTASKTLSASARQLTASGKENEPLLFSSFGKRLKATHEPLPKSAPASKARRKIPVF